MKLCCLSSKTRSFKYENLSTKQYEEKLCHAIQYDETSLLKELFLVKDKTLSRRVLVKRKHLPGPNSLWLDFNPVDPFVHFYQEASILLWAVDCQQWNCLKILIDGGLNPNCPIVCKRWTSLQSKINIAPYSKYWIRGKCTYQSALDYYFASIFEVLSEYNNKGNLTLHDFRSYFSTFDEMLQTGIDVHRIDSVIVFNMLASNFDQFLSTYSSETTRLTDIPESNDHHIQLTLLVKLIKNGFCEFEFAEYLSSCHNLIGILICLLSHPNLSLLNHGTLPPIFSEAALLLINLLALRAFFSNSFVDIEDNLENLHLRKLYVKRYVEKRVTFHNRLRIIKKCCQDLRQKPLSLRVLARNVVRKQVGGICFLRTVKHLPLPQDIKMFISYIGLTHLSSDDFPKILVELAIGRNPFV